MHPNGYKGIVVLINGTQNIEKLQLTEYSFFK